MVQKQARRCKKEIVICILFYFVEKRNKMIEEKIYERENARAYRETLFLLKIQMGSHPPVR
jgi:hypothetical protein